MVRPDRGNQGGPRVAKNDLPAELQDDAEAVAVWHAAVDMKSLRHAADRWVGGWRIRLVERTSLGG